MTPFAFFGMPGPFELLIIGFLFMSMLAVPIILIYLVCVNNKRPPAAPPCPHCGGPTVPSTRFCPHCGGPLGQPPPSQPERDERQP